VSSALSVQHEIRLRGHLWEFDSLCDEPETHRERLENAFSGLGPQFSEERLLNPG